VTDVLALIVQYQTWIYLLIGLGVLFYGRVLWRARRRLGQTPFGLEREAATNQQNLALAMLTLLVMLGLVVYLTQQVILPILSSTGPASGTPAPLATATPETGLGGPLVIDASGCRSDSVMLSEPQPDSVIAGSFEVRGTASIPNFAFYILEINGVGTEGQWVPVEVKTEPVIDGSLGIFDSSAYESGAYAFRLVVKDNAGNAPPPCMVPVTLKSIASP
jgi:hypothetical protein